MKPENGTDYGQNYDVIVKWLADALRGQRLRKKYPPACWPPRW